MKNYGLHVFLPLVTIFDDKKSFQEVLIWQWVLKKLTHWIGGLKHASCLYIIKIRYIVEI